MTWSISGICDSRFRPVQSLLGTRRHSAGVTVELALRTVRIELMTTAVDDLANLLTRAARDELQQLLAETNPYDLTPLETVAMLAIVRAVHERVTRAPVKLSVIRPMDH